MEQINNQGQPIPSQPISQLSPNKSTTPKNKSFLIFILIIGIILLILTTVILVLSFSKPKPETLPESLNQPTTIPIPTAMPTTNETADWKTHNFKTLGLEFKLPPLFDNFGTLKEEVSPDQKGNIASLSYLFNGYNYPLKITAVSVDYETAGRSLGFFDFQGFVKENGQYYGKFLDKKFLLDTSYVIIKEINNPNLKIIKLKPTGKSADGPLPFPSEGNIGALINSNNHTYPGLALMVELKQGLNEELFDQILSTFKFLP